MSSSEALKHVENLLGTPGMGVLDAYDQMGTLYLEKGLCTITDLRAIVTLRRTIAWDAAVTGTIKGRE